MLSFLNISADLKKSNIISLMSEKTDLPHDQEAVKNFQYIL